MRGCYAAPRARRPRTVYHAQWLRVECEHGLTPLGSRAAVPDPAILRPNVTYRIGNSLQGARQHHLALLFWRNADQDSVQAHEAHIQYDAPLRSRLSAPISASTHSGCSGCSWTRTSL